MENSGCTHPPLFGIASLKMQHQSILPCFKNAHVCLHWSKMLHCHVSSFLRVQEPCLRHTILISPLASPLCIMLNWKTLQSVVNTIKCATHFHEPIYSVSSLELNISTVLMQGFGCFTQDFKTASFELAVKINHSTIKGKKKNILNFSTKINNLTLIKGKLQS